MKTLSIIARQTGEAAPERRSSVRYRLALPVVFHWKDGCEFAEAGFTYDVAVDGALILSRTCPPAGCEVRVEVLIPSPERKSEQLRIQCVGKVARAVSEGNTVSFGVRGLFDDDHITRQMFM